MPTLKCVIRKILSKIKKYFKRYQESKKHWTTVQAEKRKKFREQMKKNLGPIPVPKYVCHKKKV